MTNVAPAISVIMGVYNSEKYLRETMDSILQQTFADFEFIIIDDASSDSSLKIIRSYNDPRIVLIQNEKNQGLTRSLNIGLKAARGALIARQDADDVSMKDRFQKEVDFLRQHPDHALVGTFADSIDETGKKFAVWEMETQSAVIKVRLFQDNCFCHGSTMFRKEEIIGLGGYREPFKRTQDHDLWLRIAEKYHVANLDQVLYSFRKTRKSISRNHLSEQLDFQLLAIELAKERQQKGSDSLAQLGGPDWHQVLMKRFNLTRPYINHFKAGEIQHYYRGALKAGALSEALRYWFLIFRLEPSFHKIFRLIKDLIVYSNLKPPVEKHG